MQNNENIARMIGGEVMEKGLPAGRPADIGKAVEVIVLEVLNRVQPPPLPPSAETLARVIAAVEVTEDESLRNSFINFLYRIRDMRKHIQKGSWSSKVDAMFTVIKSEFDSMMHDFSESRK